MAAVSNVNLLVASLDLQMVQSLLGAIRAADRHSATQLPVAVSRVDSYCPPTGAASDAAVFAAAGAASDTTVFAAAGDPSPAAAVEPPCCAPPPCPKASVPHIAAGPQPPWKILPWQEPAAAPNVIKITVRPPDMLTKGNLIDLFLVGAREAVPCSKRSRLRSS